MRPGTAVAKKLPTPAPLRKQRLYLSILSYTDTNRKLHWMPFFTSFNTHHMKGSIPDPVFLHFMYLFLTDAADVQFKCQLHPCVIGSLLH